MPPRRLSDGLTTQEVQAVLIIVPTSAQPPVQAYVCDVGAYRDGVALRGDRRGADAQLAVISTLIYTRLTAEDLRRVLAEPGVLDQGWRTCSYDRPATGSDRWWTRTRWVERLWASDRWPLRELPRQSDLHSTARAGSILFSGIAPQPWLKKAAKRSARARLSRGCGADDDARLCVARVDVRRLVGRSCTGGEFAGVCHPRGAGGLAVGGPLKLGLAAASKANRVTAVRLFLEEQWQDGLAGLPRTAVIHVGEVPHNRSRRLPRGIEAPVFEQFIDPANLALLPCEQHRTVILLLAFTGLRVSSIVTLPRDALVVGSDNHP